MSAQLILVNVVLLVSVTSAEPRDKAILSDRACVLDPYIQIHSCNSIHQNGTSLLFDDRTYRKENVLVVPEGTSCLVEITLGLTILATCQAGNWRTGDGNPDLHRQETPLQRSRRAIFTIKRWESEGHTGEGLTANNPPIITCPRFDPNIFYTEKGRVTAKISWKVPTVPNTENGIISVTQTQGQAPGTEHAAGTYTVTYIARDLKGQAATCSETFTVVVRRCPHEFTYILNGMVTCTLEDKYIYGSECSYTCVPGYNLTEMTSLRCESNGTWNGSNPQCKAITCGSPGNIEHGYLACETSQYTFTSICEIVCDTGYAVTGQSEMVTCQANGQWTPVGECQVKHCQELEDTENAITNCSNNNTYGSVCYTTCAQHYTVKGEASRVCQDNETWSGQPQECIKICPEPPVVLHGHYVCGSGQKYQDTCTLMCNKGYTVTGLLNITCDSNFHWTHGAVCLDIEPPELVEEFPSYIEVIAQELGTPNVVNYSIPNIIDSSGESVNFTVFPPSGSEFQFGNSTVTITATDKAGNNATFHFVVRVIARLCPNPSIALISSDPLRFHCPNGFVFGAVCNASCIDGKQPQGKTTIKCHLNGNYSEPEWLNLGDVGPYCQGKCIPGQWSASGQQPCDVCEIGFYQANYGGTKCEACPYLMVTPVYGAVSKKDCKFVTVLIGGDFANPLFRASASNISSFTAMIWTRVNYNSPRMTLVFSLNPNNIPQGSAYFQLDNLSVYIIPTGNSTARSIRYWYHVALVFDDQDGSGKLYVNGQVTDTITGLTPQPLSFSSFHIGFAGTAFYFIIRPLLVSGFQITTSALTAAEIVDYYNSCQKQVDDNVLLAPRTVLSPLTTCDEIDDCENNPCGVHATCFDQGNSFTCECSDGWSGKTCQFPPNYCLNHTCASGATCVNNIKSNNFTCVCPDGYKGPLCKDVIVNGGWSMWGEWSSCSKVCGSGQRSRMRSCDNPKPDSLEESCSGEQVQQQKCYGDRCPVNGAYGPWSDWSPCSISCGVVETNRKRVCDNPAPSNGGSTCEGVTSANILCNTKKCPECSELKSRSGHNSLNCKKDADTSMTSCQIICKPGLTIMPQVINRFQCGSLTNYVWSHHTENNPTDILPDCAKLTRPTNTTLVITYVFDADNGSTAQSANNVTDSIKQDILSALNCNISNCSYQVTVTTTCEGVKPVLGKLRTEIIHRVGKFSGEEGNSVIESSQRLDNVFNNLINTSGNLLNSCVIKSNYTGHIEVAKLVLQCPDGTGYSGSACVECPPGSYSSGNGSCILCGKGSYQDQARMTSCKACSNCSTTAGEGSFSLEQCQSNNCGPQPSTGPPDTPMPLIIGLSVGLGSFFIFATIMVILVQRSCRKHLKEHPYDIPGQGDLKDEDPYANAAIDEIYDEIEDSPYISAQNISAGSIDLNSDGCAIVTPHFSSGSYTELQNLGSSNKTESQIKDNIDANLIRNGDNNLINNPENETSASDLIDYNYYGISTSQNDYHEAEQDEEQTLNSNRDNAHDVSSVERLDYALSAVEFKPQNDSDDSSALDGSHISNTHRDPNDSVQALNTKFDNSQETVDVKNCYDSDKNPDQMNNESCYSITGNPVSRNPPLPHRTVKQIKETLNQNLDNNKNDESTRM